MMGEFVDLFTGHVFNKGTKIRHSTQKKINEG